MTRPTPGRSARWPGNCDTDGVPVAICGIAGQSKARCMYEAEYASDDQLAS